jgi:hypothetical protein
MKNILPQTHQDAEKKVILYKNRQNISNKKIYFDSDGTEIKIGYDEQTGVGFVEIIDNR